MSVRRLCLPALLALVAGCGGRPKSPPVDLEAPARPVAADFGQEASLAARYPTELQPFWDQGRAGSMTGAAGVELRYRVFRADPELGAIVFIAGRTEPIEKHVETFYDLVALGYSVYALDVRGQGASARMLPDPEVGYVEFFRDYVDDLHAFVTDVVAADGPHPHVFGMAHSMGGAIMLLEAYRHPDDLEALVVSSPMISIDTGAFPGGVATTIAASACDSSGGTGYAPGQGPYQADAFADNVVSHSEARYARKLALLDAEPSLRLGGVSYRWLCEAITADAHLQAIADDVEPPVLVFEAGDDRVVHASAEEDFCDRAPACQWISYPGAFHEIFSETDDVRDEALARAVRFFDHFAAVTR